MRKNKQEMEEEGRKGGLEGVCCRKAVLPPSHCPSLNNYCSFCCCPGKCVCVCVCVCNNKHNDNITISIITIIFVITIVCVCVCVCNSKK